MDSSLPDVAPTSESKGSGDGGHSLCAPLESVTVQGVAPEVGDSVSAKIEGTVTSVEGDKAYITVAKVNGQDVPAAEEKAPVNDEDAMLKRVQDADASY